MTIEQGSQLTREEERRAKKAVKEWFDGMSCYIPLRSGAKDGGGNEFTRERLRKMHASLIQTSRKVLIEQKEADLIDQMAKERMKKDGISYDEAYQRLVESGEKVMKKLVADVGGVSKEI